MKQKRRKKKKKSSGIFLVFAGMILVTGIMVFLYPVISNYLAKRQQENVIVGYEEMILRLDNGMITKEWEKAVSFNEKHENYMETLNIEGNGVMGYIEIPKINARIPIYHCANEESLKKGVGHLEQTGVPIGGKNNHPVLLGHRGLPGSELFTRLDEMKMGDCFYISVLDQTLAYKVKQITIVLPEEIDKIKESPEKDQITLVTCTPYGINTHRLLVTGERTEFMEETYVKQEVKTTNRNKIIIYIIIIFTGIIVLLYPHFTDRAYNQKTERQKKIYFHHTSEMQNMMDRLHDELKKRNKQLYANGQESFSSVLSYQKSTINLKLYGINNNTIGYIVIPDMKVNLPIILGASEENMKKGAVHLTETSYPIGGENTNCVIAAHRGYSKAAMFRDIEKLEIGYKVYIENFKEKLVYQVVQLRIISPTDTSQVLIKEGKDMLTLITCHPYRKNSQRYVVFCERI